MPASLWERIGGAPAVAATVDELYERLTADPLVKHQFDPARIESLKAGQRAWFAAVLGGAPADPRPDLATAHADLEITDEMVERVLNHLRDTLTDLGVHPAEVTQVMALVTRLWVARHF